VGGADALYKDRCAVDRSARDAPRVVHLGRARLVFVRDHDRVGRYVAHAPAPKGPAPVSARRTRGALGARAGRTASTPRLRRTRRAPSTGLLAPPDTRCRSAPRPTRGCTRSRRRRRSSRARCTGSVRRLRTRASSWPLGTPACKCSCPCNRRSRSLPRPARAARQSRPLLGSPSGQAPPTAGVKFTLDIKTLRIWKSADLRRPRRPCAGRRCRTRAPASARRTRRALRARAPRTRLLSGPRHPTIKGVSKNLFAFSFLVSAVLIQARA